MEPCFTDTFLDYDEHYAVCIKSSVGSQCVRIQLEERGRKPAKAVRKNMRGVLWHWFNKQTQAA